MGRASLIVLVAMTVWGASLVLRSSIPSDENYACQAMFRLHGLQGRYTSEPDPNGQARGTYWTADVARLARGELEMRGLAEADTTSGQGVPYHGYYFRALPPAAGDKYAICAYPAEYGKSKLTYFINGRGVFSKDLGGRILGPGELAGDPSWAIID